VVVRDFLTVGGRETNFWGMFGDSECLDGGLEEEEEGGGRCTRCLAGRMWVLGMGVLLALLGGSG